MHMTASFIFRIVTIVALLVSATAMSWAQTAGDGSRMLLHKGHQISQDMAMSMADEDRTPPISGLHHDTVCATGCAVAGSLSEPVGLGAPLALAIKSVPALDLRQISLAPEPGRRPPKINPILVYRAA